MSEFRTLVKGSAIAFSGNALIYGLAFVFQVLLVRLLGTEGFGIWGFAYTLMLTVAQLSTLGLGFAAVYFAASGGPAAAAAARVAIVSVLGLSAAAALALPAAARLFIVPFYRLENIGPLLYILSAAVPLAAFVSIAESVFKAHHDAAAAFKMKLVPEALKVIVVPAALLCCGVDVRVVGAAMLLVLLAPAAYGAYMLNKLVLPLRTLWPAAGFRASAAPMLAYALPFFLMEIFQFFRDRVDTFVIGYVSTAHYLGVYKGAYVLAALVSFVPNAVVYLLFPLLSRVVGGGSLREVEAFGERTIKLLIYSGMPLVVFVAVFAGTLMFRVLGQDFTEGQRALILLALSSGMGMFHAFYGTILASKKQIHKALLANVLAFILVLALDLLLIPRYGITGAGAASLAGSLLLTFLVVGFASASLGKFIFPRSVSGALVISAAALGAAYFLRERSFAVSAGLFAGYCGLWALWLLVYERASLAAALEELRAFAARKGLA